jgi:predicted DNA-binding ribbon-helix-helix protein
MDPSKTLPEQRDMAPARCPDWRPVPVDDVDIVTCADRVYRWEKLKKIGRVPMCQLFAHQPQRDYESQTRSLRIDGHCTSIRLEMAFWDTLEEIASKEDMSLAKFLTRLHSEVLDHCGEVHNFASLLRCSCLIYRSKAVALMPDFLEGAAPRLVAAE